MQSGCDSIWVIVDSLTKSTHFLPVKKTYSLEKLAKLYVQDIVRLHSALVSIVSNRDPRFTSRFWLRLQNAMGTKLKFSIVFHPRQMDSLNGQFKFWKICSGLVL